MSVADLAPEELERIALSTLRTTADVRLAESEGVTEDSFQLDSHAGVWKYLLSCAERDRAITVSDVELVTGVVLDPTVQDVESLIPAMVAQSVSRRSRIAISERLTALGGDPGTDPVGALHGLIGDLGEIVQARSAGHSRYFDADLDQRLREVEILTGMEGRGETPGILTGIRVFDEAGDTWKPGEVVALVGALGSGKSWWLLAMAAHAYWRSRCRILFLSPESTVQDVEFRLDPINARYLTEVTGVEYGLTNRGLRSGTVDIELYRRYIADLRELGRRDWVTRDSGESGSFTIPEVLSLAREHRPDVLVIDGFHLLSGEGSSWETMKQAAADIKGLAQSQGLVVLVGSQVQRNAVVANDSPASIGQVAYGMGLMETANRVISLAEKKSNPRQRIFTVTKFRDGEKITRNQYLRFDVDNGDIRQTTPDADVSTGFVDFD